MIPDAVVRRALASGDAGRRWMDGLDDTVRLLEARWQIRVGEAFSGGTAAFAAPATGRDGRQYVLRVAQPDSGFAQSARALELANGRGCARIHARDDERNACLLERLGPSLRSLALPVERQIEALCAALGALWHPMEDDMLPNGAEVIGWFRRFLPDTWRALKRPCPETVIDGALRLLDEREAALRPERFVLLHGDPNSDNLLSVPDEPCRFRLIDPDGLISERAYDLGVLMREWPETFKGDPIGKGAERCLLLSRLTGEGARAIWQWGVIQCVSTGLICRQISYGDGGATLLTLAAQWLEADPFPA